MFPLSLQRQKRTFLCGYLKGDVGTLSCHVCVDKSDFFKDIFKTSFSCLCSDRTGYLKKTSEYFQAVFVATRADISSQNMIFS